MTSLHSSGLSAVIYLLPLSFSQLSDRSEDFRKNFSCVFLLRRENPYPKYDDVSCNWSRHSLTSSNEASMRIWVLRPFLWSWCLENSIDGHNFHKNNVSFITLRKITNLFKGKWVSDLRQTSLDKNFVNEGYVHKVVEDVREFAVTKWHETANNLNAEIPKEAWITVYCVARTRF